MQQARAFQATPAFDEVRRRRQAVEHRLARLVQLGLRQARYVGHPKTLFQLAMAATVANLTLLAYAAATAPATEDGTAVTALLGAAVALLVALTAIMFARNGPTARLAVLDAATRPTGWSRRAGLLPGLTRGESHQTAGSRLHF